MAVAKWQFILTDTEFKPVGEVLNAAERSVTLGINRIDAASFTIRLDNFLADPLRFLSGYLKVYRNGTLLFFGPLMTAEEAVDDQGAHVTINAVGAGWIFSHRLCGKDQSIASYTAINRALIIQDIVDIADEDYKGYSVGHPGPSDFRTWGDTYIDVHTLTMSASSSVTYTVPAYKWIIDVITELSAGTGGFEWRIMPRENWVSGKLSGVKIGNMTIQPLLGAAANAVFQFGVGQANVASYTRSLTRDGQANRIFHLLNSGPSEPDGAAPPRTQTSITSATLSSWGIMEDIAQADLTDRTMRQQLVDAHGLVRQTPRTTLVFTPSANYGDGRQPEFGVDYNVGDTVTAQARYNNIDRFVARLRVWGIQFNVNEFGVETPVLTLSDQGAV